MKTPLFHPAEGVNLQDFLFAVDEYPREVLRRFVQSSLGIGVLSGFRTKVLPQQSADTGRIEIYNGFAYDQTGGFITSPDGTNSQQITLGGTNQEFWLEIEFFFANSDPDQRVFWDTQVDNPDPVPDGQEVAIAQTFTRKTLFWRVLQPIQQNAIGNRGDVGYTPARFSDNDTLVVPHSVFRTDNLGRIMQGVASTEKDKNDLISVTTPTGQHRFMQSIGYGEVKTQVGGYDIIRALKTTDQRLRLFEPLVPPMLFGELNEVIGDATSDHWMRDIASLVDFLATAISQIKHGVGASNLGPTMGAKINAVDPDWQYIDIQDLIDNSPQSQAHVARQDDFMGCTFQITSGAWSGFYVRIMGNDATDGGGVTRVYIQSKSNIPKWEELPAGNPSVTIIQQRNINWLAHPTPSSGKRGLNALDKDVWEAMVDAHNTQSFSTLRSRLDGNKSVALTISPNDTKDAATGNPTTQLPADTFGPFAEQKYFLDYVANTRKGGTVRFRRGIHNFDAELPKTSLFTLSSAHGLIFEGESAIQTTLSYGTQDDTQGEHIIFDLSNCSDIEFRNLTFTGKGKIFKMVGCSNIRFINCIFDGLYWNDTSGQNLGLTTSTLDLGDITDCLFEKCIFRVAGEGLNSGIQTNCSWRTCKLSTTLNDAAKNNYILKATSILKTVFSDLEIRGEVTIAGIMASEWRWSHLENSRLEVSLGGGASSKARLWISGVGDGSIKNCSFTSSPQLSVSANAQPACVLVSNLVGLEFTGNEGEQSLIGFQFLSSSSSGPRRSMITSNRYFGIFGTPLGNHGIVVNKGSGIICSGNHVERCNAGFVFADVLNCVISNNYAASCYRGFAGNPIFSLNSPNGLGAKNCTITGNVAKNPLFIGFDLNNCHENQVSGNHVEGSPTHTPYDVTNGTKNTGGHINHGQLAVSPGFQIWFGDDSNENLLYIYNTHRT